MTPQVRFASTLVLLVSGLSGETALGVRKT
jgi:hypothetical protein